MKATASQIAVLRREIAVARDACSLSDTEIGVIARVHPSQVGRVCRGEFRTVSHNVVQICKTIGLEIESVALTNDDDAVAWQRLESSLRELWDKDKTPEGADRIVRVLDTISAFRVG